MKAVAVLLSLAASEAAPLAPLDCDTLKKTNMPYEIEYRMETRNADGTTPGASLTMHTQVFRREGEIVSYTPIMLGKLIGRGAFLRSRGRNELFPAEIYSSISGETQHWTYSIKVPLDPLAAHYPLSYSAELTGANGKAQYSANMTIQAQAKPLWK